MNIVPIDILSCHIDDISQIHIDANHLIHDWENDDLDTFIDFDLMEDETTLMMTMRVIV